MQKEKIKNQIKTVKIRKILHFSFPWQPCEKYAYNYPFFWARFFPHQITFNLIPHTQHLKSLKIAKNTPPPYFICPYMVAHLFRAKQTARIGIMCYFRFRNRPQKRFQTQNQPLFFITHVLKALKTTKNGYVVRIFFPVFKEQ